MCNGNTVRRRKSERKRNICGRAGSGGGRDFPQIDVGHQTVDSGSSANIKQDK